MKRNIIAIVTLIAIASAAHARNDGGPSNNNGPTFGGSTTVTANPSATAGAAALSSSSATGSGTGVGFGGAGGAGGAGGSATAVGLGGNVHSTIGNTNSVRNDVSSTNINANSNQQGQHQGQGQQQGQLQGQQQQAVSNSGGNRLTNEGNNAAQKTSVTVEGDIYEAAKIPVATAYAAPLTASNGTCMGSSSGGAQGPGFGVSFGSTWTDSSCDMRYDAEALRAAGQPAAAIARLCQKPEIAAAMEAAGTKCPGKAKTAAAPAVQTLPVAEQQAKYEHTDPIVRARLGLAPLSK